MVRTAVAPIGSAAATNEWELSVLMGIGGNEEDLGKDGAVAVAACTWCCSIDGRDWYGLAPRLELPIADRSVDAPKARRSRSGVGDLPDVVESTCTSRAALSRGRPRTACSALATNEWEPSAGSVLGSRSSPTAGQAAPLSSGVRERPERTELSVAPASNASPVYAPAVVHTADNLVRGDTCADSDDTVTGRALPRIVSPSVESDCSSSNVKQSTLTCGCLSRFTTASNESAAATNEWELGVLERACDGPGVSIPVASPLADADTR